METNGKNIPGEFQEHKAGTWLEEYEGKKGEGNDVGEARGEGRGKSI